MSQEIKLAIRELMHVYNAMAEDCRRAQELATRAGQHEYGNECAAVSAKFSARAHECEKLTS